MGHFLHTLNTCSLVMFTLYCIAIHIVILYGQFEQMSFAIMLSIILNMFNVKHVPDQSKK